MLLQLTTAQQQYLQTGNQQQYLQTGNQHSSRVC